MPEILAISYPLLLRRAATTLSLSLFMLWIGADHPHDAMPADHLTTLAARCHRSCDLHTSCPLVNDDDRTPTENQRHAITARTNRSVRKHLL